MKKSLIELIDPAETSRILGCKNADGLKHLIKKGVLRPELIRRPNSRVRRFIRALVEDLAINLDDPEAHDRAIQNFYAGLDIPSYEPRKPGRKAAS